ESDGWLQARPRDRAGERERARVLRNERSPLCHRVLSDLCGMQSGCRVAAICRCRGHAETSRRLIDQLIVRAAGQTVLTLVTLAAAGCAEQSRAGAPTVFDATMPLPWVDPARSLAPCPHTDQPYLVTVDASARRADDGAFRLHAEAQPALAALIAAAARASFTVTIGSAHRTYEEQGMLWDDLSV